MKDAIFITTAEAAELLKQIQQLSDSELKEDLKQELFELESCNHHPDSDFASWLWSL